MAVTSAQPST